MWLKCIKFKFGVSFLRRSSWIEQRDRKGKGDTGKEGRRLGRGN